MHGLNDIIANRMSMIFWMLSKGTAQKWPLTIWSAHGECWTPQYNLNDDAGSFTQNRHLPILFLESVLCEPCVGVQTVLFSSSAFVRPLKLFCVFCCGATCTRRVSVG